MKVTINIDCTPEEARRFFGLPDMEKLQETVVEEMRRRMAEGLSAEDLEKLMKLWMPAGGKAWESLQKMFWTPPGGTAEK
ncbi:MAG: hypothetical protein H3C28_00825 [Sphingomonadales bacterium]|nr:hypothetical protein [Sphingomonadales bacterium]